MSLPLQTLHSPFKKVVLPLDWSIDHILTLQSPRHLLLKNHALSPKSRVKKQWHPITIAPFGCAAEMIIVIFGSIFYFRPKRSKIIGNICVTFRNYRN
jgi:hypothetical protein